MIDRLIPRSKDTFNAVNCAASVMKDIRIDQVKRVMAVDPKDSLMLQNVSIQPLGYG